MTITPETFERHFACVGIDTRFADMYRLTWYLSNDHLVNDLYLREGNQLIPVRTAYNGTLATTPCVIMIQSETDRVNDILKQYES